MSRKKTQNVVRLGLFVTIGAALFIIAIYLIGSNQNLFGETFRISSIFGNVNGLQAGNNVRYSGINVGTVENIVILNDTTLQVNMKINEKVRPFIKKDALTSIGSDGLVGSMLVNINPGPGQLPMVEDGDTLRSYTRIAPEDMLNTLGTTNENIALISNNLLRITEDINKGQGAISMLLHDQQLATDLKSSLAGMRQTTDYLSATSRQLRDLITEVEESEGLFRQLLHDTTVIANLNSSIDQFDTVLITRMDPILEELQRASQNITATSTALRAITEDLEAGTGPAGALLRDTTVENDIRTILENLNEGSVRLNENLEAMRSNWLFRRYFKKKKDE